jgi:acetyl esterase
MIRTVAFRGRFVCARRSKYGRNTGRTTSVAEETVPTRIPQPLGGFYALIKFLVRHKLLPSPAKMLVTPHDERLKHHNPGYLVKPGPAVDTEDVVVEGRDGPIAARVYTRPGSRPGAPAILFIHGGAFMDLGVDHCDNVQRGLAQRTGYVVVGLSYRLAPEHPFPAALHDCADVLQWMYDTRPGGLDPLRIAVGGESAGGNLTVALCLYARDHHGPPIGHQSVYYPFTDTSLSSPDWDSGLMPGADRRAGTFMVRLYAGHDPDNPLVHLLGADLRGLPPATVVTCGHDVLRTDGVRLVEALRAADVETRHTHYDDMPHGFLMLSRLTSRADESMDEMAREVTKRLGPAEAT